MNPIHIVIADDHSLVRKGIRDILEDFEDIVIVGEAWDGPSLFTELEKTQPTLLLFDVTMPNFDPITALQEIKRAYPELKILVVSAYDDDIYVKGLLAAGADGYHLKGQPIAQLKMAVDQVTSGQKWIASPLVNKFIYPSASRKSSITLTTRQSDLLRLLTQSLDNQKIALKLGISIKTVENNLTRLYRYLDVQSRLEAVNFALKHPEILSLSSPQASSDIEGISPEMFLGISILLIDDNPRFRRELRQIVNIIYPKSMIYEAENISEALHLVEYVSPNLILIDMILGKEDGIQATRELRKKSPNFKIIVISAYPDKEFHRLSIESGAIAFLDKKDLDIASLRQILSDIAV